MGWAQPAGQYGSGILTDTKARPGRITRALHERTTRGVLFVQAVLVLEPEAAADSQIGIAANDPAANDGCRRIIHAGISIVECIRRGDLTERSSCGRRLMT